MLLFCSIVYVVFSAFCGLLFWASGIANSNPSTYLCCLFLGLFWPVWLVIFGVSWIFGPILERRAREEEQRIYREEIKRWEKEEKDLLK